MFKILNRKLIVILFLIAIIMVVILYRFKPFQGKYFLSDLKLDISKLKFNNTASNSLPFKEGENLTFRLDLGFLTIGRANLVFEGQTELNGSKVYLIKFVTHANNFHDTEKIFAEIDSFLPLKIERDIRLFGRKINIVEEYNQKDKFVKLTRFESGKSTQQIIRSDKKIENILCLIYLYRMPGRIDLGERMSINLPLKKIEIEVTDIRNMKIPKGSFEAYVLESKPKGCGFWFDTSTRRLPLSIDGVINFGKTRMVLIDFN